MTAGFIAAFLIIAAPTFVSAQSFPPGHKFPPAGDGESDWKNTGGTTWSTGANWTAVSGSAPPGAADVAWFKTAFASGQPNLTGNTTIVAFYFGDKVGGTTSSGYDITSSSTAVKFTLTGTATTTSGTETSASGAPAIGADNTSGTNTIDAPIILGQAATVAPTFFQAGGGTLVINGVVSSTNAILGLSLNQGGTGTATFTLSGANTYSGTTRVSTGDLLNINGTTAISAGALVFNSNATIDNTSGAAITLANNNALTLSGGSLTFTGTNDLSFGTGAVSLGNNRTFTINGGTLTLNGVVSETGGSRSLTKVGAGTLVLGGNTNTYTGATNVNGGTLKLDYGASGSNTTKLADGAALNFGGGTLNLSGGSHTEVVVSTTLTAGASVVTQTAGTSTLRMNAITSRANGSTINFTAGSIADTDTNNLGGFGILGGYATVGAVSGAADWAKSVNAAAADTAITAFTTYDSFATSGSDNNNPLLTGSSTLTANLTTNSLKINSSGAGQSLDIVNTQTLTLNTGGLMYVGANDYEIKNGTLKSATATNSDLIVQQWGAGNLTISSVIANGTGASTLTKAGTGTLILGGVNTYTGATFINGGTLNANAASGKALGTTTNITVNNGGTLLTTLADQINHSATMTLNGGTFNTNGTSQTLGALTLTDNSLINLGSGASILSFADSHAVSWTSAKVLEIDGWSGSQGGGGIDQLIFGSAATGLSAGQLAEVIFHNPDGFSPGDYTAMILASGEVVPVPETATWFAGALALGVLAFSQRRRFAKVRSKI